MIFLPGGGISEVMGGSVHIKENVRGGQGKEGRWRGETTKLEEGAFLT